jgi:hypothetical protein
LDAWTIPQAQEKARELQRHLDEGRDPRQVKAEITAADVAKRETDKRETATIGDAWQAYIKERRPHWSTRYYVDHEKIEAWILQQAGVTFEPQAVPGALRVVKD